MTDTSMTDASASSLFTPPLVINKWAKYTQELTKEELAKMMLQEREWYHNANHQRRAREKWKA